MDVLVYGSTILGILVLLIAVPMVIRGFHDAYINWRLRRNYKRLYWFIKR